MCGYCTEEIALDIARNGEGRKPSYNKSLPFEICLYLQETQDLNTAVEILNDIVDDPDKLDSVIADVILCRLTQLLFGNGFNSEYQNLIKNQAVQWTIETRCSLKMRATVGRMDVPFAAQRLMKLYDPKIYLDEREWDRLISGNSIVSDCVAVLQFYIDWWLNGIGLQKNSTAVSSNGATIVDYLNERNQDECNRFELLFRVFFFSVLVISRLRDHSELIQELKIKNPYYMPDFFGMDLWVRRVVGRL